MWDHTTEGEARAHIFDQKNTLSDVLYNIRMIDGLSSGPISKWQWSNKKDQVVCGTGNQTRARASEAGGAGIELRSSPLDHICGFISNTYEANDL